MPAATEARRLSMANVLPRHVWRKTCHDVEFRPDKRSSCCPGVEPGEPAVADEEIACDNARAAVLVGKRLSDRPADR